MGKLSVGETVPMRCLFRHRGEKKKLKNSWVIRFLGGPPSLPYSVPSDPKIYLKYV